MAPPRAPSPHPPSVNPQSSFRDVAHLVFSASSCSSTRLFLRLAHPPTDQRCKHIDSHGVCSHTYARCLRGVLLGIVCVALCTLRACFAASMPPQYRSLVACPSRCRADHGAVFLGVTPYHPRPDRFIPFIGLSFTLADILRPPQIPLRVQYYSRARAVCPPRPSVRDQPDSS